MKRLLQLPLRLLRCSQNASRNCKRKYYLFSFRYQAIVNKVRLTVADTACCDHPIFCVGSGDIIIEQNVKLGYYGAMANGQPIMLQPRSGGVIKIQEGTIIVNGTEIVACERVEIGKQCRIGSRTFIIDSDFHGLKPTVRDTPGKTLPVRIGDNVLIGANSAILKGVIIGNDAVIGACSVVSRGIEPGDIVCGNPARVVGSVYKQ